MLLSPVSAARAASARASIVMDKPTKVKSNAGRANLESERRVRSCVHQPSK